MLDVSFRFDFFHHFCVFARFSRSTGGQGIYRYDVDTIDSSIKCELSEVAKLYGPQRARGPVMTAFVAVTGTETLTKKVGGNLFIGATYETFTVRTRAFKKRRNINVDNNVNCSKSFVVSVGVYSCFVDQRHRFFSWETISCSESSMASMDLSAGVKTNWIVEASITGDLVSKREWKIEIVAPLEK
ncbi:hypothetical protein H8B02_16805 [Bradyrhizobium sp. Pear77]|uniref:hypothetical protein n=1 Tax=Bradyrhizobium altum TaxID=1571202 RepID=UPI001E5DE31B|nr:hypothetical protein [Bradyrhizobium altum]MCC8955039.1 hypothetical protein [Bradyrhizobium altum]